MGCAGYRVGIARAAIRKQSAAIGPTRSAHEERGGATLSETSSGRAGLLMRLALLLACSACTRTVETRSESSSSAVQQEQASQKERVVETRTEGPGRTVVYKFAPPKDAPESADAEAPSVRRVPQESQGLPVAAEGAGRSARRTPSPGPTPDSLPPHGALVEMDVIDTGPIVDSKSTVETSSLKANSEVHTAPQTASREKDGWKLPWWLYIAGAGLLALGYAILRGYLKIARL